MLSEKYHILVEEEDNKHRYLIMFEFALFDHFEGVCIEGLDRFSYLLIIIIIWPVIWQYNLKQMKN